MAETLAELARKVEARPYTERVELLNVLSRSLYRHDDGTDSIAYAEDRRQYLIDLFDSFKGRVHAWDDEDPLEYQRKLRAEERV